MAVTSAAILAALTRVKGPDLDGNIVERGLVSEVLIKEGRVYFSITVPAERAKELEPMRAAAGDGGVDGGSQARIAPRGAARCGGS
jgi:ATP-binding protein involved in chromosome partitioning